MSYVPTKIPLKDVIPVFDLKFLLAGDSGSGKTHLCGTYTKGPVHFYMLDKTGEVSLRKLLKGRPEGSPITVDILSDDGVTFSDVWKKIQEDAKAGMFDYFREHNGLVVLDSITNGNIKALANIASLSGVRHADIGKVLDMKKGFSMPHWGQLLQWMQTLASTMQTLPCATATTVHLMSMTDGDGNVCGRKPLVNGQFRELLPIDFTEVYLLEVRGDNHIINFKEKDKFIAKSKAFSASNVRNFTMDMLAEAYLKGDTLKAVKTNNI